MGILQTIISSPFFMKKFFATSSKDYGTLALRLAAGALMLPYGITKVQSYDATIQFMTGMGIPSVVAMLVIVAETVGAVSLVLGFCTRFCAASLGVVMVGAVYAMFGQGFFAGYATPLLFLCVYIPLVINGAGALSLDGIIAKKVK